MRTLITIMWMAMAGVTPVHAQDVEPPSPSTDARPVELGGGVILPRPAFDEIMSRPDGLAVIERMQQRAEESRRFEGVPHLGMIFVAVLLFLWSSMIYYQLKHARLHRTIQRLVEKEVPIPAELLRAAEQFDSGSESAGGNAVTATPVAPPWASNLMWGGILWITIGVAGGLYLYLRESDAWPWALAAVIYGGASVVTALGKSRAIP